VKINQLDARFIGHGGEGISDAQGNPVPHRPGIGVIMECPCGKCDSPLYVPFENPLDGGPRIGHQGWQRTGNTIDDLTLTPSVLRDPAKGGCGWHGYITNGNAVSC
jgi:hypothetical protein